MGIPLNKLSMLAGIMAGNAKANDAVLSALIATHPEPDALRDTWQQLKPGWIDKAHEQAFFENGSYLPALLERLTVLSDEIDAAIHRPDD